MIQKMIVYILIIVAVILIAIIAYKQYTHPEQCAKHIGCTDCPLLNQCNKSENLQDRTNLSKE